MEFHVICCNDLVEYVVGGSIKKAQIKLEELREAYFNKNSWNFKNKGDYYTCYYWHIHTVEGEF